jgi:uncharacterized protein YndB with AHSA1/START domain
MSAKAAEKTSLEIKRFINAPRVEVYAAWTDPAQLKLWFGPEWVKTRDFVCEVRPGGKFRWDLIDCDGEEKTIGGEYLEIIPGQKIVFTWKHLDDTAWENRTSVVTLELSNRDGGTELRLTHVQLPTEASRNDHNEGWKSVLDRLERFVNK